MTNEVICRDKFGNEVKVSPEQLEWRVSVCGILLSSTGEVLFVQDESTKEWELPGGGIELEETAADALRREFQEETTLDIEVGKVIGFTEDFYYHKRDEKCYKTLRFCFVVTAENIDELPQTVKFMNPQTEKDSIKSISLALLKQMTL